MLMPINQVQSCTKASDFENNGFFGPVIVSDFDVIVTLADPFGGDTRKGRRPSFVHAAPPEIAIPLYERFLEILGGAAPGKVESGEFGAMMDVALVNAGPVTLVLER